MSKKSQREQRQKKEELSREREQKFSATLADWLQAFAEYYRQDPPTETAIALYSAALGHLSPEELNVGCKEALRKCEYFPRAKEILDGLLDVRHRQETARMAPVMDETDKPTPEESALLREGIKIATGDPGPAKQKALEEWQVRYDKLIAKNKRTREPGEEG